MSTALTILSILGAVALGLLLSRVPALGRLSSTHAFAAGRTCVLAAMVAAMGFRVGRTEEVIRSAGALGLASLVFAAATMAGTLIVLTIAFEFRRASGGERSSPRTKPRVRVAFLLGEPLLLLGMLAAGFLAGFLLPVFPGANGGQLVTGLLYSLLVVVGMGLGASGIRPAQILSHPDLLLIPLGTIFGSLAGGLAAGLALNIRPGAAMSLASGFGWYSLSGVILTRLDSPGLGAVSFLSNMLRESMALVLIPLLARTRFPFLAIGAGGATSMDVTLPLIEKNCGPTSVPLSIASGGVLSLSVPFLVPLLFRIGL
ncbi:MAG: lysine exporter LysO family protein [Spirochaetia bacterium]|jgi:uncharacterized membrane protein YbjE (DUF340 family)